MRMTLLVGQDGYFQSLKKGDSTQGHLLAWMSRQGAKSVEVAP